MLPMLLSILLALNALPLTMQSNIKPKTCLQAKELTGANKNGFYVLFNSLNRPFTTYCDYHSDPGFVWTLVESLSLANAQSTKYRKGFQYDVPSGECSINWHNFRLCKAIMKSIADTRGSTHFRATCNFNTEDAKGLQNHRDYLRVSFCSYANFFKSDAVHHCTKIDYVNIRGHSCRQCNIPLYSGYSNHHVLLQVDHAANVCDKWTIPGTGRHEFAFGDYRHLDSRFSCANSSTSATNWWIGGSYLS